MTSSSKPTTSFTRDTVEKYYKKGDALEIDGKKCIWVTGGETSVTVEIDGKSERIAWSDINNIPGLGSMRLRAGMALRSLLDAGWIKVARPSPGINRLSPNPFLIEFAPSNKNLNIYYGYGSIPYNRTLVGEYQLKATESLTNLPAYADNALVHRAIEEQQSIRAGDCAIPFQGSISFYYYVGDTSALPDGINEDTVEEYQNAFKSA